MNYCNNNIIKKNNHFSHNYKKIKIIKVMNKIKIIVNNKFYKKI